MLKGNIKLALILLVAFSLILGGCGSGSNNAENSNAQGGSNGTEEVEKTKLLFLGFKGGAEAGALPDIIDDYMKANPNVEIEYEYIGTANGYNDVLKARLAAGEKVDVFMSNTDNFGLITDAGYAEDLSQEPYAGKVLASLKPLLSSEGKLYGLPIEAAGLGMFVNEDMLKEHGIEIPTNWEQFLAASEALKQAGELPMMMGNKSGWSAGHFAKINVNSTYGGQADVGAKLYSGEMTYAEAYLPALQKLQTLIDNDYVNAKNSVGMEWNQQSFTEFVNGNGAFMLGGTWQVAQLKEANPEMTFAFIPMPAQEEGTAKALLFPGVNIFVNAKSDLKSKALEFVQFVAEKENLGRWAKSQSAFTTIEGGISTDAAEVARFAEAAANGDVASWIPEDEVLASTSEVKKQVQLLLLKQLAPEKAAENIENYAAKQRALK
ncbi:ABC transporter substrate-binding protein [Paenibacillus sp. strain BS8-2]